MKNELLKIGPLTLYGYGFMIAIGVLAAWLVVEQRARKLQLACEHIFYLVLCSGWICICKNSVLDYRMERSDPESVGDVQF